MACAEFQRTQFGRQSPSNETRRPAQAFTATWLCSETRRIFALVMDQPENGTNGSSAPASGDQESPRTKDLQRIIRTGHLKPESGSREGCPSQLPHHRT